MANPVAKVSDPQAADAAAYANHALWYAFKGIGRAYLIERGTSASSDATVSGVHGYSTIEAALANPNSVNTFSQLTISQWNEYASLPVGGGALGVVETVDVTWSKGTANVSTAQNPTTAAAGQIPGLQQIGEFFAKLGQPNTWLRVAEVTVGVVLLAVALNKVLGNPAGGAVKLAAKVP